MSDAKLKEGVFIGPQIRRLITDFSQTSHHRRLIIIILSLFCGAEKEMHGLHSSRLFQISSETTNLKTLKVSWSTASIHTTSWAATCPWKSIFLIPISTFSQKTWVQWAMNTVNVFIKIFLSWNHGTKAVGAQWCSQTTVGRSSEKIPMLRISDVHRQKKLKDERSYRLN